ncbi:MAG: YigZ family protein [Chloroflexi bacterium]|nr:YigZ family protein [Chloroflexota bacterium]MCL5274348.1 YigZ family protein [Chloroflexota bacterium]
MATRYPIPGAETRVETTVVNSRFICSVGEARTVEDAVAFIRRIKAEYGDASSHAYAYHVGYGASVTDGCNDGGEPGGTAGRPMLAVLQGSGLGDVVTVVSRWFGGTKLGTGGLVRAFSGALKAALAVLPRSERVERKTFLVEVPYPLYERLKLLVTAHHGALAGEEFGASVLLTLVFAVDDIAAFGAALRELSAGSIDMLQV